METGNVRVEEHINLVHDTIKRYFGRWVRHRDDYDDIFQEGCIGLLKAAGKFDPAKGFQFSTFAVNWIRGVISVYLYRSIVPTIGNSREFGRIYYQIKRKGLLGKAPKEIAHKLGYTLNQVQKALELDGAGGRVMSIDYEYDRDDKKTINMQGCIAVSDNFTEMYMREFSECLDDRDKKILCNKMRGFTQMESGEMLGMTKNAVNHRIVKIKKRLHRYLNAQ